MKSEESNFSISVTNISLSIKLKILIITYTIIWREALYSILQRQTEAGLQRRLNLYPK